MARVDEITFNLEGMAEGAFYVIYAGLRMFKDLKESEIELKIGAGQAPAGIMSVCAAEAFCFLEQLKEAYPKLYAESEQEYNESYTF